MVEVVITYNAPDPGQRNPNPQVVRDGSDRIRVWDEAADRYGWAELAVEWEGGKGAPGLPHTGQRAELASSLLSWWDSLTPEERELTGVGTHNP